MKTIKQLIHQAKTTLDVSVLQYLCLHKDKDINLAIMDNFRFQDLDSRMINNRVQVEDSVLLNLLADFCRGEDIEVKDKARTIMSKISKMFC